MGTRLFTRSVVLPDITHGRTIIGLDLLNDIDLAATKTEEGVDFGGCFGAMTLTLTTSAVTGTSPTADIIVEHSHDAVTWVTLTSFTQATGATTETKTMGPCRRFVRAKATLGGTAPKFTVLLTGDVSVSFI